MHVLVLNFKLLVFLWNSIKQKFLLAKLKDHFEVYLPSSWNLSWISIQGKFQNLRCSSRKKHEKLNLRWSYRTIALIAYSLQKFQKTIGKNYCRFVWSSTIISLFELTASMILFDLWHSPSKSTVIIYIQQAQTQILGVECRY